MRYISRVSFCTLMVRAVLMSAGSNAISLIYAVILSLTRLVSTPMAPPIYLTTSTIAFILSTSCMLVV